MDGIRLIVGLGNPGAEHRNNRHNAGFWFLDLLARQCRVELRQRAKLYGAVARAEIAGHTVGLFKPDTYMNRSARGVQAVSAFYKIDVRQMLVVHDEIDFPPAQVRLKLGGGHGGHNGLRDIIAHLGADFWRLRIGVGHPGDRRRVVSYVLGDAKPEERSAIEAACGDALAVMEHIVRGEFDLAANNLHSVS